MTVTANIHCGIVAWTNHSFALNERCSNAGNAYHCTTAGGSTAAPTGTGTGINNGGTAVFKWLSAVDYTTLDAWQTSISGTLSQPYIGLLWNDGEILRGTEFAITGHTTTATNNITLKCAPGESFTDNPNRASNPLYPSASYGVMYTRDTGNNWGISVWDSYTVLDGIQFRAIPGQPTHDLNSLVALFAQSTVSRCTIQGINQANNIYGILVLANTLPFTIVHCLIIDEQLSGYNSCAVYATGASSVTFAGSIVRSVNGSTVSAIDSNALAITNSLIFGYGSVGNAGRGPGTTRNILTDCAGIPAGFTDTGSASLFSKTASNQFVGVGTDYKLKTGADAINAGYTDTTNIPSATDIYGTSRPQGAAWDIGPHELVSAAPGYRARVVRWG